MQKNRTTCVILLISLLVLCLAPSTPALAQEEGFKETFDDPSLPGWEHSRETIVADGVLRISPGGFALHIGDWNDITLTIKLRMIGEGEVGLNYYFREGEHYRLILFPSHIALEKEHAGIITPMGDIDSDAVRPDQWITVRVVMDGQQHQIYVNDDLQISATDPEPLETGAILLLAMGEVTAEFDELELQGTPFQGLPPEERQPPALEIQPPQQVESPALAGTPIPLEQPPITSQGWDSLVQEFFASQASTLELTTIFINLILAAVCSYVLSLVYIHLGSSLSNRRKFAANFMLVTMTTTFIILVVRSSVALSLGLVGALSIVRFRTAIKEPEELAYLFLAIGLGIGLGDNQRLISFLALAVGILVIALRRLFRRADADVNLHLSIASHSPNKVTLEQVMEALHPHTAKIKLLRFDETADFSEAGFLVEFVRLEQLHQAKNALQNLSESIEITFMDNKGLW